MRLKTNKSKDILNYACQFFDSEMTNQQIAEEVNTKPGFSETVHFDTIRRWRTKWEKSQKRKAFVKEKTPKTQTNTINPETIFNQYAIEAMNVSELTRYQIAKTLGINSGITYHWESGSVKISAPQLKELMVACGYGQDLINRKFDAVKKHICEKYGITFDGVGNG